VKVLSSLFAAIFLLLMISCNSSRNALHAPKEKTLPPVVAEASVDKALISTEDGITFSVVVNYDAALVVAIPDIGSKITGFRVTDFGTEDKQEEGNRKITRKWFSLRADMAGSYILPEVEVTYPQGSVKTSEIFIEVQAPKAESGKQADDLKDIKDIERTPLNISLILSILLAALAIALAVFFYIRVKRKPRIIAVLPPHEIALKRLETLTYHLDLADPVALKRFYFDLSDIMRSYIEGRYGLRATDMTSDEIVKYLQNNTTLPEQEKPKFVEFLKETDIVKFTDFLPPLEAAHAVKEKVKAFVLKTTPNSSLEREGSPGESMEESVV
jgi:hypothetical protein